MYRRDARLTTGLAAEDFGDGDDEPAVERALDGETLLSSTGTSTGDVAVSFSGSGEKNWPWGMGSILSRGGRLRFGGVFGE